MSTRLLLGGLKSYLPLPAAKFKGTGGSVSGAYCYTVWLRHLSAIAHHLRHAVHPRTVVELGPGDSIGLGLAALLTGADRYIGLDVLAHASIETNLRVLDELVDLFRSRAPLPGDDEFPRLHPRLSSYAFPRHLVDEAVLTQRLSDAGVASLRAAIADADPSDDSISYLCPWTTTSVEPGTADLVVSQVALQDMDHEPTRDDLSTNIRAMATWLRPGGVMSHQVDFSCPGVEHWNQHWSFSELTWTIVRGKRPYYVNRVPLSEYVTLFERAGCRVVGIEPFTRSGLARTQTTPRYRNLPDEDFRTTAALFVVVKDEEPRPPSPRDRRP
jgi:hypothetical protein